MVEQIDGKIGKCKVISLPCCIHLFGKYDFLAALPKQDRLEIRFNLHRTLDDPRLKQSVPASISAIKNCIYITTVEEIDKELIGWLDEAFYLKS